MSIFLLILAPGLIGIYWLIRLQICLSRMRYLIDTYGMDRKKLRKLSCKEVKLLRNSIEERRHANDAIGLDALIKRFRA